MADNQETPFGGNFSIQDTMEMGMGNAELLNDLMSPDTASASPDDIKDISAEDVPAPKATKASTKVEEEEKTEDTSKSITDFLLGDDDTEDEEEEGIAPKAKVPATPEESDEESEPEVSRFTALATDLLKLGVFTNEEDGEEEPITSPEQFLERFQEEKKKGAIEVHRTIWRRLSTSI
jgi:hypothetical protein